MTRNHQFDFRKKKCVTKYRCPMNPKRRIFLGRTLSQKSDRNGTNPTFFGTFYGILRTLNLDIFGIFVLAFGTFLRQIWDKNQGHFWEKRRILYISCILPLSNSGIQLA